MKQWRLSRILNLLHLNSLNHGNVCDRQLDGVFLHNLSCLLPCHDDGDDPLHYGEGYAAHHRFYLIRHRFECESLYHHEVIVSPNLRKLV